MNKGLLCVKGYHVGLALYGARGQHPALLGEDTPLSGCPGSRYVTDKVEVEKQVRSFRERETLRAKRRSSSF